MVIRKTTRTAAPKTAVRVAAKSVKPAAKPRKVVPRKVAAIPPAKAKVAAAATTEKSRKEKKVKVVRDSFTMPEVDYARIAGLKKKCVTAGFSAKKSELLRAGLQALDGLSVQDLKAAISKLENVKTGRPLLEKSARKA